jgi:hypothetical protein
MLIFWCCGRVGFVVVSVLCVLVVWGFLWDSIVGFCDLWVWVFGLVCGVWVVGCCWLGWGVWGDVGGGGVGLWWWLFG